jgi:hypothetical protein
MRLILSVFILALFTVACSKVPSQSGYPYSYQGKLQSADHWEEIAQEMVGKQVKHFFTNPLNRPDGILGVYIDGKDKSTFGIAFQTYLATELFENEIPVSGSPEDCFTLDWSVQKVIHQSDRAQPGPPAGIFGYIAYGIGWIFGGDYYAYGDVPHTELLVTMKVSNGNFIYSRATETLYIDDEDTSNYWVIPDSGQSVPQPYVIKGTTFCREVAQLEMALSSNNQGGTNLDKLLSDGKCAIATQDYQVTILGASDKHIAIKHANNPNIYYVTRSSLGG